MSAKYNPKKFERKWQEIWEEKKVFRASDKSKKKKFYLLVEFPYPSGEGLHVGHCRSYVALDILARKRRMEGFNVLFPMGWDAFGLPTENYAIKTGIHPVAVTRKNTAYFKRQEENLGLSFDWSREINTADPGYYKWTQWIFLQLFKKGLAYKVKMPVNWCSACKIGLANEEVVNGKCERCGAEVTRREKEQWMLKITKYAERLIQGLNKVDYPERVKISQKEWIGKSEGWEIQFPIFSSHPQDTINVFTTRPDTLFGCTYLVLAPEHPLIEGLKDKIINYKFVKDYIEKSKKKVERERVSGEKEKTGVKLEGVSAVNPVNGRKISIFVADYALMHYGTGAIMAVPAHDQRDFDFAKRYNLPIIEVIVPQINVDKKTDLHRHEKAYEGKGILVNSGRFTGMKSEDAKERVGEWLGKKGLAKKAIHYKLRDWIFSRQRYWGEPIPIIKCEKCGWVPVPKKDLPVELPRVKEYKPTEKGESPLAKVKSWVNAKCPKCGGPAKRETDVMPNWAGSNWYYLRYCDPKNGKRLADPKKIEYWMAPARRSPKGVGGVDWYNGGMEHTTLHLLYSRFIYKFLWDIKAIPKSVGAEPYKKRTSHGMILGEGGIKMSKSKGNVINPDKIIKQYGADTLRVYEMFMGPFEQVIPWDTKGLKGVKKFLQKVWQFSGKFQNPNYKLQTKSELQITNSKLKNLLHKTIKKVSEDIESLKFNTAVSSLMEFVNAYQNDKDSLGKNDFKNFLKILSPFAPHLSEELWSLAGFKRLCCQQKWPKYKPKLVEEKMITLVVQINGKVRDKIETEADISQREAEGLALKSEKVKKWIKDKKIKKTIFVPGKLINLVAINKN